ncbi:hypothetical protein ABTX85_37595 [Streptomyces sp. NPDC096097]|uniref:hypothetical protein n=1 Tax=Streptomyces sp. NPDC096097 TaxID=3155546 RepID=UPI003323C93B
MDIWWRLPAGEPSDGELRIVDVPVLQGRSRMSRRAMPTTGRRLARRLQRHARVRYYELDDQFRGAGTLRRAWYRMWGIQVVDVIAHPIGQAGLRRLEPSRPGKPAAVRDRTDRP